MKTIFEGINTSTYNLKYQIYNRLYVILEVIQWIVWIQLIMCDCMYQLYLWYLAEIDGIIYEGTMSNYTHNHLNARFSVIMCFSIKKWMHYSHHYQYWFNKNQYPVKRHAYLVHCLTSSIITNKFNNRVENMKQYILFQ